MRGGWLGVGSRRAVSQGRLGKPTDLLLQGPGRIDCGDAPWSSGSRYSGAPPPATSPEAWRPAARLGLPCVFIPHDLEPGKILGQQQSTDRTSRDRRRQLGRREPAVHGLPGQVRWGFANINLRAYYAEGAKTMGFEIAEQLGWRFPDRVVSPVAAAHSRRASSRVSRVAGSRAHRR